MLSNHPCALSGNGGGEVGPPGSAEWGAITGTLSDQTDLQTALDAKAPLASPTFTGTPAAPTASLGTSDTQIATTAFVQEAIAEGGGGSDPSPTGNRLLSGGGVAADGGLDIVVEAANYVIQGVGYSSVQTPLTAAAADPTNPRIDVVAVDSNGDAVIITGTPAATPLKPDVDPVTQLELTFILVEAAATDITVNIVDVYRENVEYTMTESGTSINLASTNNPRSGSTDIEGTLVPAGDYFQAEAPGTLNLADYDSLIFFIRSKASWPNAKQLTITARNSGAVVGQSVVVKNGTFGFDSSITGSYQLITIPTSFFAANGLAVNQIRWACAGGGSTIGFYVDDISLQGGIAAVTDTSRMQFRGDYNSTVLYNLNDVVVYDGVQYTSIQAGQGNTPSASSTFWKISAQQIMYGTDAGASDTYAVTFSPVPAAYVTGMRLSFKANTANTGACTINANGLGAKTIKKVAGGVTTDLSDNDIRVGQIVDLVYDGTNFQMQSLLGNAGSASGGSLTKIQFTALDNQPPAANFATIDTRNSVALLNFDAGTDESAVFAGILPEGTSLTTGLSVIIKWTAATATSGDCVWVGAWERCNTDIDSDSFATGVSATTTTNGTSGVPNTTTINFNGTTEIDGLTVGDMFRLKITRDADAGGDTMTGDAQLLTLEVQQR